MYRELITLLGESRRYALALLVAVLRNKPEGRGFDFRWGF
jgi:hypothetical protein